jgi:hypothetical protein
MSLNWHWEDKLGEVKTEKGDVFNIYAGNALFIVVHEFDNQYQLVDFAVDEQHFKNMLGLNAKQGYSKDNLYNGVGFALFRLNTAYKRTAKIVELFAKARTNINIELYNEPNDYSDYK